MEDDNMLLDSILENSNNQGIIQSQDKINSQH